MRQGSEKLILAPIRLRKRLGVGLEFVALSGDLVALLVKLKEYARFAAQNIRLDGLVKEVHGARFVPAEPALTIGGAGSEKNDGRVLGAIWATEELGCLETADPRHQHVKQDNSELVRLEMLERFLTGAGFHEAVAQVIQNYPQGEQIGRVVIDQQNARLRLGWRTNSSAPTRTSTPAVSVRLGLLRDCRLWLPRFGVGRRLR